MCGTLAAPWISRTPDLGIEAGDRRRGSRAASRCAGRPTSVSSTTAMRRGEGGIDIAIALADDRRLGGEALVEGGRRRRRIEARRQVLDVGEDQARPRPRRGRHPRRRPPRPARRHSAPCAAARIGWRYGPRPGTRTWRKSIGGMSATSAEVQTAATPGSASALRRVDAEDAAMRDRRADDAHVELAGEVDVGGEAALPGEERPVLQPPDRAADDAPSPHLFGRGANRLEDVLVAGAAAEIGGEHLALRVLAHRPDCAPARRRRASGSPACRSRTAGA